MSEVLRTPRLDLVASTVESLETELAGGDLGAVIGAAVPPGWPPGEYDADAMRMMLRGLRAGGAANAMWTGWYAIERARGSAPATLVGSGGYMGPPTPEGTVEIGYSVLPEYRGRGFATEIATALVTRALAAPGVTQVIAHARIDNPASVRVLERCGFVHVAATLDPGLRRWRYDSERAPARAAAVLVPVYRDTTGAWRLVIVRRAEGGVHGGQLAFPGGARDGDDATLLATATREALEEIGLPPASVHPLAELPPVETRVSGFRVTPFLARIERPAVWRLDAREIVEVLEPALAPLVAPGARQWADDLLPPERGRLRLPFYAVGPHRLWGVSERIARPLFERIAAGEWPELLA